MLRIFVLMKNLKWDLNNRKAFNKTILLEIYLYRKDNF